MPGAPHHPSLPPDFKLVPRESEVTMIDSEELVENAISRYVSSGLEYTKDEFSKKESEHGSYVVTGDDEGIPQVSSWTANKIGGVATSDSLGDPPGSAGKDGDDDMPWVDRVAAGRRRRNSGIRIL